MKLRTWLGLALTLGAVAAAGACASNTDTGKDKTPIACSQGTSQCGDVCISTDADPNNCGDCGVVCGASEVCDRGACAGSCGASEATSCGGACVNTDNDPANCGGCGVVCGASEVCDRGACAGSCGASEATSCGGSCVNTEEDSSHCGSCGNACKSGEECAGGECVSTQTCQAPNEVCGGKCVNIDSDTDNCGGCGNPCAGGETCVIGDCALLCGQDRIACGDACVDTATDAANCGECGKVCNADAICSSGGCVALVDGNGGVDGGGPLKVAIAHSGTSSANDVKGQLNSLDASFSAIDLINIAASTPTLAELQGYRAVAVFTYLTLNNATAMGDVLADYVDAGGGVVVFTSGTWELDKFDQPTDYTLKGRYAADYALMAPRKPTTSVVSLGDVVEPSSPLLSGVSTFACAAGTGLYCNHLSGPPLDGALRVASWSDGSPLVLRGEFGGHRVVELNFFAGSKQSSGAWDAATDGAKLIRNALKYVTPREITADARLDLGSSAVGAASADKTLVYTNASGAARTITGLTFSGGHAAEFASTATLPLTIPAGGTATVKVRFTPTATGLRGTTLGATIEGYADKLTTLVLGKGT